jgi:hypothetical protein
MIEHCPSLQTNSCAEMVGATHVKIAKQAMYRRLFMEHGSFEGEMENGDGAKSRSNLERMTLDHTGESFEHFRALVLERMGQRQASLNFNDDPNS